jgi:hypothetical protein
MPYHWNDLGPVVEAGLYEMRGLGVVEVSEEDLYRATIQGGNPRLIMGESLYRKDNARRFHIRFMRPQ